MTTIAVVDNKVYGDGQTTAHRITGYNTKKIVNFGGAIVAGAGRWSHVVKFQQWVYENLIAEQAQMDHPEVRIAMPEKMVDEDFLGLVLYQDGTLLKFEGCDNSYEVQQPHAIGSGEDFAIACLHNGLSGEQAIETAIYFDTGSGGEIQVEGFDEEEELTEEDIRAMSHEDLLKLVLGGDGEEEEEVTILASESVGEDIIVNKALGRIHSEILENDGIESIVDFVRSTSCESSLRCLAVHYEVKFAHNIGIEKLRQRILDFLNEED